MKNKFCLNNQSILHLLSLIFLFSVFTAVLPGPVSAQIPSQACLGNCPPVTTDTEPIISPQTIPSIAEAPPVLTPINEQPAQINEQTAVSPTPPCQPVTISNNEDAQADIQHRRRRRRGRKGDGGGSEDISGLIEELMSLLEQIMQMIQEMLGGQDGGGVGNNPTQAPGAPTPSGGMIIPIATLPPCPTTPGVTQPTGTQPSTAQPSTAIPTVPSIAGSIAPTAPGASTAPTAGTCGGTGWNLIWGDEFNGTGLPNEADWNILNGSAAETGSPNEQYTNRPQNINQENGNLVLTLMQENYNGGQYTGGALITGVGPGMETYGGSDKHDWLYGRFEARMKWDKSQSSWPAFWLYVNGTGENEIDIMEYNSNWTTPDEVGTYLHPNGQTDKVVKVQSLPDMDTNFHLFAMEWYADHIDFYLDNTLYLTATGADATVFNQNMYLLFDLMAAKEATGTGLPAHLYIDYVHVCQK